MSKLFCSKRSLGSRKRNTIVHLRGVTEDASGRVVREPVLVDDRQGVGVLRVDSSANDDLGLQRRLRRRLRLGLCLLTIREIFASESHFLMKLEVRFNFNA